MQCMFTLNKNNHNLPSDNHIFFTKFHTTNVGLKSFAYQAGCLWNKLPDSFRTCESLKDFKTKIVTWSIDILPCNLACFAFVELTCFRFYMCCSLYLFLNRILILLLLLF